MCRQQNPCIIPGILHPLAVAYTSYVEFVAGVVREINEREIIGNRYGMWFAANTGSGIKKVFDIDAEHVGLPQTVKQAYWSQFAAELGITTV